jgi:hypothetical protein
MQAPPEMLGQLVSMGALVGGTVEYVEILKRRAQERRLAADRERSADTGLQGLVRVFLADGDRADARDSETVSVASYRPE